MFLLLIYQRSSSAGSTVGTLASTLSNALRSPRAARSSKYCSCLLADSFRRTASATHALTRDGSVRPIRSNSELNSAGSSIAFIELSPIEGVLGLASAPQLQNAAIRSRDRGCCVSQSSRYPKRRQLP